MFAGLEVGQLPTGLRWGLHLAVGAGVLAYTTSFVYTILAVVAWFLIWRHVSLPGKLPPGTIGALPLTEYYDFVKDTQAFMKARLKKYGLPFTTDVLFNKNVVIGDLKLSQEVLQKEGIMGWPSHWAALLGDKSMAMLSGDAHKRLRRHTVGLITRKNVMYHVPRMRDIINDDLKLWAKKSANGEKLDSAANFGWLFFKMDYDLNLGELPIALDGDRTWMDIWNDFNLGFHALIPIDHPFFYQGRALNARRFLYKIFKARGKYLKDNPTECVMQRMLDNPELDDEEVWSTILTFLFAAFDASRSSAMNICWYMHKVYPDVLEKIRAELHEHNLDGNNFDAEQLDKCDYLERVVFEMFRWHPTFNSVTRDTTREWEIPDENGNMYKIPPGYKIQMHTPFTNNAYTRDFNPDDCKPDYRSRLAEICTFGGGTHHCPGRNYAIYEMKVFTACFVLGDYKFDVSEMWNNPFPFWRKEFKFTVAKTK